MPLNQPPVNELVKTNDCRYTLVVESSKRARELIAGAQPLIDPKDMKPLKIAVEEINRGLLTYERDADAED